MVPQNFPPAPPPQHSYQLSPKTQIKNAKDAATVAVAAFDSRDGFDVVFECTGAESAIQMSVFVSNLNCSSFSLSRQPFTQ